MTTIMAEHRRKLGDFEVVEVADDAIINSLRQQLDVDVPMELHWTWNYGSEVEELRALYERGKKGQWNAEEDLDWSIPMDRTEWFMPKEGASLMGSMLSMTGADDQTVRDASWDELAHLFSQLLHGEQAALQLCGQLTNVCPTMDQKWYAGSQVIDEVRHVEVFSKFLQRKMGVIHPIDATLKILLDKLLEAPTWKLKVLGMQTLFEGMAVGIMDQVHRASFNPLVQQMLRRVHQDEARHAAFGVLSMRRIVQDSTPEEMAQMEDFAFDILETLNANQQLDMLRNFGPKYGLDPDNVVQMMHGIEAWPVINSEVFMHTVMPNLRRLGLVTERTEQKYRDRGILYGDPASITKTLPMEG